MIRPPLFGKDSSPHYTAPRLAGAGTGGFCIIFFLFVWFAPAPDSKPKYETVRIVLETTPVEEIDTENNSQTNTVANEQIQENKNSAPVKEEPKYTKRTDNIQLKKSVDELLAEQEANRPNASNSNTIQNPWAQFDENFVDTKNVPTNTTQKQKSVPGTNALDGKSASSAKEASDRQSTANSQNTSENLQTNSSDSSERITNALDQIAETSFEIKKYNNNGNSTIQMKSEKSPNNDTLVSMQDGSSRTLIKPKKPKINISPEDAKYVDGNPTVTIIFTVMEDGSIPESSIKIRPESLLPSEVSDDIKFQLSNWKFQSGSRATASFEFTIKKN